MFNLPIEIWEDILGRLSAEDLMAFSQVSTEFKNLTDSERLWKPHCLEQRWTEAYLPLTDSLENEYCLWRNIYESNLELSRRWRYKMWTRYSLSGGELGEVYNMCSDSKILAVGYRSGAVNLWNISNVPSIICTIKCVLCNHPILDLKISKEWISFLQDGLLQIYGLESGHYFLYKVLWLELGPNNINVDITATWRSLGPYFHSWYMECLRVIEVKSSRRLLMAQSNSHLVACQKDDNMIYSLELGKKEDIMQLTIEAKVKELLSWEGTIYIVVWEHRITKIFEYKIKDTFSDQIVKSPSPCRVILSENLVLTVPTECGFTLQKLRVWLRKSGESISSRVISSSLLHACVTKADIIIYSEVYDIWIWDPTKDLLLHRIKMEMPVNFLDSHFSNFFVVQLDTKIYIYDWQTGKRLYSMSTQFKFSEDYINLIWTSQTTIVAGGIYNHPELHSLF